MGGGGKATLATSHLAASLVLNILLCRSLIKILNMDLELVIMPTSYHFYTTAYHFYTTALKEVN